MINMLKNLHKEESGQDLIEYGSDCLDRCLGCPRWYGYLGFIDQQGVHPSRRTAHLTTICLGKQAMQAEVARTAIALCTQDQDERAWPSVSLRVDR